ncbi:MAG: glutamate mutase L, partial [Armatimonadota bacterium]
LGIGEKAEIRVTPGRGFDVGEGKNRPATIKAEGGVVGLIIDGRGRPVKLPSDDAARVEKLAEWFGAFGLLLDHRP